MRREQSVAAFKEIAKEDRAKGLLREDTKRVYVSAKKIL